MAKKKTTTKAKTTAKPEVIEPIIEIVEEVTPIIVVPEEVEKYIAAQDNQDIIPLDIALDIESQDNLEEEESEPTTEETPVAPEPIPEAPKPVSLPIGSSTRERARPSIRPRPKR